MPKTRSARLAGPAGEHPEAEVPDVDLDTPAPVGPHGAVVGVRAPAARLLQRFSPAAGTPRNRRSTLVAAVAAIVALPLILGGAGLLVSRLRTEAPARSAVRTATAIDPGTVRGSASSVQRTDGGITYTVGNTLDGNPTTAWNSNGARDGRGPGIVLTYTFASPVVLSSITIRNGYQKVRPNGVDLWERNERVKQLQVTTDTGHWTWDLDDVRAPQTLERELGRTRAVRLKILQVYPSTRYSDVAISEIAFTGVPAS